MASSFVGGTKEKYDVFLSFRGPDTRQTFTSHLHAALIRRKVETYIDYRLERGDEVGCALKKAINESKISVIILSENYASSTWCLDELAYILECKTIHGQSVIPIFYEVDPSHVRRQIGTYETAFSEHEQRFKDNPDKVAKWKAALVEAANLSGFDSTAIRDDYKLVEEVVSDVLAKLKREPSIDLTSLIGAEGRIQKILLELDIIPDDVRVRCVVLWGPGGIGKTTLAEAVYHGLSSQFEPHYFLANVRELSGTKRAFSPELRALRNELLRHLLGDSNLNITSPTIDNATKSKLCRAKVLVVLDDVNDSSQLRYLAGEVPFGPGSRIIVTTRDMQPVKDTLLVKNIADYDVKIYKVEQLNNVESLQLLQSNAPMHAGNSQFLKKLVDYAAGIPLALEILHRKFYTCKTEEQLVQLWAKLKKFPDEKLRNVYTASYDGLERNEKEIFLDLACFHKWKKRCDTERILAACGLFPDGIDILIDMSLISIKGDCICMHDVIQEMAWETVREESPQKPEKRSRLHNYEDVCTVLEGNKGTANMHCISCRHYNGAKQLKWVQQAFFGMYNLRFLMLSDIYHLDGMEDLGYLPDALRYLDWNEYPLQSLPSKFSPDNLVELHMPWSKLKRLWGKSQNLENLKTINLGYSLDLAAVGELSDSVKIESINLEGCESLVEVPDLSNCTYIKSINLTGCINLVQVPDLSNSLNIERINLAGCKSLVQVPSYFQRFTKLTHLDLQRCSELRILPDLPGNIESLDLIGTAIEELTASVCSLEKLHKLNLKWCSFIKKFSSTPWKMRSLSDLCLRGTKIERVPSFSYMTEITSLDLRSCYRLVSLPADICELKYLETLDLSGCSNFTTFPEIVEPLEHLQDLNLSKTNLKELPSSFGNLVGIRKLSLSACTNLESLPNTFYNLKLLKRFSLCGCVQLKELPLSFILSSLTHLDLEGCRLLKEIPDCFISFPTLQFLDLSGTMIKTISPSIKGVSGLKSLRVRKCKWLQSLPVLPCLLEKLDAEGCTSLKTVSVSVTAHTQGLDEMLSEMESSISNDFRTESHSFLGCVKLDKISKSHIMDDAFFRIMRLVTIHKLKRSTCDNVAVICPGDKIPKWFNYQKPQGSSLNIKLPLHWSDDSNFLGFALCSVFEISAHREILRCDCEMTLKNRNGETHTVKLGTEHFVSSAVTFETDHMFVWYVHGISDEAKLSTEASFHFYTEVGGDKLYNVKRCGVCFLGNVYRASYDGLERNEREIFLDLACFHKGQKRCDAERILAACGLFPEIGIDILIDISLISIEDGCIWMQDVIQEMAWETVREESPQKPEKRSRLHNEEDICRVLEGNKGTANVQSISFSNYNNYNYDYKLKLDPRAFTGMASLRYLKLHRNHHMQYLECLPDALRYLDWNEYPFQSLPSKFSPDNLVELHMLNSKLKRLWGKSQNLSNLRRIDLSWSSDLAEVGELSNSVNIESINLEGCASLVEVTDLSKCTHIKSINLASCENLVQVPDLSNSLNIESINLGDCEILVEVPSYFQRFTKLTHLNLRRCSELCFLPDLPGKIEFLDLSGTAIEELPPSVFSLEKLLRLNLDFCSSIKNFSSTPWKMRSVSDLCLRWTKIERVPSFSYMTEITSLDLRSCYHLVSLPSDICELKSLETLDLSDCSSFTTFPEIAEPLKHLQDLNLSKTNLKELPSSFGNLVGIRKLSLSCCTNLELLPDSFQNLKLLKWLSLCGSVKLKELPLPITLSYLTHLDLQGCELLKEIPDCFTSSTALKFLDLSGTMIETIPPSIKEVSGLKSVRVRNCKGLQSLPVLPYLLEKLDAGGSTRLETVSVSVTAHTQGLDEMLSERNSRTEFHSFLGCVSLDKISRSCIMDDARFRIMRLATIRKTIRKLDAGIYSEARVSCPGNEIPKWFSCETPGSSMNVKLPLHWSDDSNFLGIALCSVSAALFSRDPDGPYYPYHNRCEMILKTNNGETHTVNFVTDEYNIFRYDTVQETFGTDHMLVWLTTHHISDEAKRAMEASFNFIKVGGNMKKCGVCFLYAQDDDALNFEVIPPQQVTSGSPLPDHFVHGDDSIIESEPSTAFSLLQLKDAEEQHIG
ncbi:disease resistance protein RUN1-like [Argentina anserina]|uniref:disease resistance protein RUN1-like n=1 Tax=Argentina anserina TaxID=57926 RepID=UPI0021764296|nr:disease resistance protein RUN1-like [Potentilla anserina]